MSDQSLDRAIRQVYSDVKLTKEFAANPAATLEKLGVATDEVKIGEAIIPSAEEAGQVCGTVCPGIPLINACIGYTLGKDV